VYIYIIKASQLASRDLTSSSDPYLKVYNGDKEILNDRANYFLDDPEPTFNKVLQFDSIFPGQPPVVIHVYDYDDLFGDDLIGTTKIDLEDRFYNHKLADLVEKPIEERKLNHQTCIGP
jgi:Ca2+-dependent lipid-binding protein